MVDTWFACPYDKCICMDVDVVLIAVNNKTFIGVPFLNFHHCNLQSR